MQTHLEEFPKAESPIVSSMLSSSASEYDTLNTIRILLRFCIRIGNSEELEATYLPAHRPAEVSLLPHGSVGASHCCGCRSFRMIFLCCGATGRGPDLDRSAVSGYVSSSTVLSSHCFGYLQNISGASCETGAQLAHETAASSEVAKWRQGI